MQAVCARRKKLVQTLRRCALAHGVERVPDNANRDRVRTMALSLMEAVAADDSLPDEEVEEVEKAWASYQDSWPDWVVESEASAAESDTQLAPDAEAQPKKTVWNFQSAQLTYNCTTGDWSSKDQATLAALFERFKAFLVTCLAALCPKGISVTMEQSTLLDSHVHTHVYFHLAAPFRAEGKEALDFLAFENIHPHLQTNTARGNAYLGAVNRGHFYVVIDKIGSLFAWTNYPPFSAYGPEAWWIDNWYKQGKLSSAVYLGVAARIGVGFQRRLNDIQAAEKFMRDAAVEAHVAAESAALKSHMFAFKSYDVVDRFIASFQLCVQKHRRPMLAIIGGTNLGKSLLASHILERVANLLGTGSFLEVTVEGSPHLDLNGFDHRMHAGVLLDGVGDAFFLRSHREVLQGRPKIAKGAQSATNVYAYKYTLARRAVIATFDLSATNLEAFEEHYWLSDERNVMTLKLDSPAFIETPTAASSSRMLPSVLSSPLRPGIKRRTIGSPGFGYTSLPFLPPLPR
jgi:hypothetical protein